MIAAALQQVAPVSIQVLVITGTDDASSDPWGAAGAISVILCRVATLVFILHAGLGVADGLWALKSALRRVALTLEELALAVAWGFVVGGSFWLRAFLARDSFLGFYAPWTWLTAAPFHVAGFAALTITALCVRLTPSRRGRSTLRSLLVFHPLLFAGVAAGLTGVPYVDDVAAVGYATLFAVQLLVIARTVTWSLLPSGSSPVRVVILLRSTST